MYAKLELNTFRIIRNNFKNLIIVTALFLTGCSLTFPEPDASNQTILSFLWKPAKHWIFLSSLWMSQLRIQRAKKSYIIQLNQIQKCFFHITPSSSRENTKSLK